MGKRKLFIMVTIVALMISVFAGCSSKQDEPPANNQNQDKQAQPSNEAQKPGETNGSDGGTIRVGVMYPLSGSLALLGNDAYDAVEIIADMVNEQGGVNGKKIELVKADAPDATAGQNEANRLIKSEKVPVIIGTYASGISMVGTQVAERNKVVYVETTAVADDITNRGFKYTFRVGDNASLLGISAVDFVKKVLAPKLGKETKDLKVVIMHEESAFGTAVAVAEQKKAEEYGIQILSVDSYKSTTNSLSSTILKYKGLNPDIVLATSYINDAVLFIQESKQYEFKPKAIIGATAGYALADFAQKLGADADGIFVADAPADPNPQALSDSAKKLQQDFLARWHKVKGTEPTGLTWRAVNGAWTLFHEALPKAKTLDSEGIREALLSLDIPEGEYPNGVGVKFNGPDAKQHLGQNVRAKITMMQWQDGKYKLVWPDKYANAAPIKIPLFE